MPLGGVPLSLGALYVGPLHMVALVYAPSTHQHETIKWVIQVMKPSSDMVSMLLREVYGHSLNWNEWATLSWGDSLVVAGFKGIFSLVWPFFRP